MNQNKFKLNRYHIGLGVILLCSLILNFYKLGQEGYGNSYYAAAVKSMLTNWHSFFFNSFDPMGFITIDKPPVDFWFQTLSAYIFGFKGWSLFFPQALAGVLSVALLYHLVARVFGRGAGLLAALFLAFTPVVVAADRTNEVDSMLMLVTLVAAWMMSKAVDQKSLKWLLFAFIFVGVGFNIKMMEAFLVLPAFYLVYLIIPRLTWSKKIVHLLGATGVLVIVALSWSFIVDSIPADQRPYVGSTQNNSMVGLAIGYNGINRLVGQHGLGGNSRMWTQRGQHVSGMQGTDVSRQNAIMTDQSSMGLHRNGNGSQSLSNRLSNMRNGNFSMGQTGRRGIFRLFVTPELSGQLSWLLPLSLLSIVSLLWGKRFWFPAERKRQMAIFWSVWVLTMVVFFSIAGRFSSYYMVMLAPGVAALAGAGFKKMWDLWRVKGWRQAWYLTLAFVLTVVYEITVVWRYPALRIPLSLVMVIFALLALSSLLFIKKINGAGKRAASIIAALTGVLALTAAPAAWAMTPIQYGGAVSKPFAGPELKAQKSEGEMTFDPKLENYLKQNYHQGTYLVATLNSRSAAPIMLDTDLPVMAMGGFMGNDPALTVEKLQTMVHDGQVRYFLLQGGGFENQQTDIVNWILANCKAVPAEKWQNPHSKLIQDHGRMGFGQTSMTLYEYTKKV